MVLNFKVASLSCLLVMMSYKAAKLKFLVDIHTNELLETIADVRDDGLKNFETAKTENAKCHKLTEGFRQYAAEVCTLPRIYLFLFCFQIRSNDSLLQAVSRLL